MIPEKFADNFINESYYQLNKAKDDNETAKICAKLLKSNEINCLSGKEFAKWVHKIENYLEIALDTNRASEKTSKKVQALLNAEIQYRQHDIQLPIIRKHGSLKEGKLEKPKLSYYPSTRIHEEFISQASMKTQKVLDQKSLRKIGHYVDSAYQLKKTQFDSKNEEPLQQLEGREEANALVHFFSSRKQFYWKAAINCEYRAQAMRFMVDAFCIDPKSVYYVQMGKKSFFSDGKKTKFKEGNWGYHFAIAVETKKGEMFIIDPAASSDKALTPDEWKEFFLQNPKEEELEFTNVQRGFDRQMDDKDFPSTLEELDTSYVRTAFAITSGNKVPGIQKLAHDEKHPLLSKIFSVFIKKA